LIRNALEQNHVVGGDNFRATLASLTKRHVSASFRGRPPKSNAQSDEAERSEQQGNLDWV